MTLWHAETFERALERAEAADYAATWADDPGVEVLDLFQIFWLSAPPGDGSEAFSLMRDSHLAPADYVDAFFETGTERQRTVPTSD